MRQSKSLTLQCIELKCIFRKIKETNFGYCLKTGKMREEEGGWREKERGRRVKEGRREEGGCMAGGLDAVMKLTGNCMTARRRERESERERERGRERGVEPDGILQLQHQQQQQPGFKQIYALCNLVDSKKKYKGY